MSVHWLVIFLLFCHDYILCNAVSELSSVQKRFPNIIGSLYVKISGKSLYFNKIRGLSFQVLWVLGS